MRAKLTVLEQRGPQPDASTNTSDLAGEIARLRKSLESRSIEMLATIGGLGQSGTEMQSALRGLMRAQQEGMFLFYLPWADC